MSFYAVIVNTDYMKRYHEQHPQYVMRVNKETKVSLIGLILEEDGSEGQGWHGYETKPSYSWSHTTRKNTLEKPGRVVIERLLSRHATFESASAALKAAKHAWGEAEDREAYRAASVAYREAADILEKEKTRLQEEMRVRLRDLQAARDAACAAMNSARAEMHKRQTDAAISAAINISEPQAA